MHEALLLAGPIMVFGMRNVGQTPVPTPAPTIAPARCEYYPTPPIPAIVVVGRPQLRPAGTAFTANVLVRIPRGAGMTSFPPLVIAVTGRAPNRMNAEGPMSIQDVRRRFGFIPSPSDGDLWLLTGTLPARESFAVYYDEVWPGREYVSDRPCSTTLRRLVTTVAEGPQREAERDVSRPLPLLPNRPVSTELLSSVALTPPSGVRALELGAGVRTVIRFRAAPFRPRRESEALTFLDARAGFDVAIGTSSDAPAAFESRLVVGRSRNERDLAFEQFAWSDGDPVATNVGTSSCSCVQPDGSWLLTVPAGFGEHLTLHIVPRANGMIQIVDVAR